MASTTNIDQNYGTSKATTISTLHPDIIEKHILTRLDCLTLTSLSCISSYFHTLSSQDPLWKDICVSTWPSVNHPRVCQLISAFPGGHRSFFSDSFPSLTARNQSSNPSRTSLPSELISAVDLWYQNKPLISKVLETEAGSGWFQHSPFRVDLLDPKEVVPSTVKIFDWDDDMWQKELEEKMSLSWIIIDPTCKRAGNFSSSRPVSVQRHWLTGEVRVEYGTVLDCDRVGLVECKVVVTCGGREQGELHVREVCMQVEDIDGKYLNGKDSLVTLMNAMKFGRRKREKKEGRKGYYYEEYMLMKKRRRERKLFRERMLDLACVAGFSIILAFTTTFLVGRLMMRFENFIESMK